VPSCQALRGEGCEPIPAVLTDRHWRAGSTPKRLERRTGAGESPVGVLPTSQVSQLKYHGTREIPWEAGPPTAQGYLLVVTDSAQYREGTVKSTPARGVKESLKPPASMQ
jgi:hypothetical protein